MQRILNKEGLSDKELKLLEDSEILDKVDFKEVRMKSSNDEKENSKGVKPKYYL